VITFVFTRWCLICFKYCRLVVVESFACVSSEQQLVVHFVVLIQLTDDKKRLDGRLPNQHRSICM